MCLRAGRAAGAAAAKAGAEHAAAAAALKAELWRSQKQLQEMQVRALLLGCFQLGHFCHGVSGKLEMVK